MTARVLVLRAIGLGDLLTGVPALRAIRRALPDHDIVLAAPRVQQPLVALIPEVDTHLPTAELAPVSWSGPPPEIAVDLHGNGPATKLILQRLLPARLVAFAGEGADGLVPGPPWDPDEHETRRWCRLVGQAFGVETDPTDLRLDVPSTPSPAPRAVVVHPGAAYASRRWPAARFGMVARRLARHGYPVVVTGTPDETELAHEVGRHGGLPEQAVLAGRTDLAELAALVARARLVVSGDSGVAHLASAFATPSVVLFGPVPPRRWGPPPGPHVALWHGQGLGDPHGSETDAALLQITAAEVIAAAEDLLARTSVSRRRVPTSIGPSASGPRRPEPTAASRVHDGPA